MRLKQTNSQTKIGNILFKKVIWQQIKCFGTLCTIYFTDVSEWFFFLLGVGMCVYRIAKSSMFQYCTVAIYVNMYATYLGIQFLGQLYVILYNV